MAYNYYPTNYPPYQYPQAPQYSQSQGVIWVQGKNAAQSYFIPAGQSAILLDSDAPYAYKKETAPDGRPLPMETYRLVREEEAPAPVVNLDGYVKADEVEEIVRREVESRMSEISFKPTRKAKATEE